MDVRKWKKFQLLKIKSGFAFEVPRFANIRTRGFTRGGAAGSEKLRQGGAAGCKRLHHRGAAGCKRLRHREAAGCKRLRHKGAAGSEKLPTLKLFLVF